VQRRGILSILLVILSLVIFGVAMPARAQDPALVARLLAAINADRIANGLPPYAYNALLSISAQRHSEYQSSIGHWTHDGADGSRALQRAQAVGYPAARANENVYSGNTSPEEVANWWYTADQDHRNNILHPVLREIGLGIAPDAGGQLYWTMDISAQPNVLPIFINNDSYATSDPYVTLTLWNEGVFYGAGQIGQATQVMISNSPDFSGAATQAWAQSIRWTLDTSVGAGTKTVYVRFSDSAGRTADSQDSIAYDGAAVNSPPIIPLLPLFPTAAPTSAPPQPSQASVIVQPQPTATIVPTDPAQVAEIVPTAARPTQDYALFRATPSPHSGVKTATAPEILGIAITRLRDILFGILAIGVGLIALGMLALIRSWKRAHALPDSPPEEELADGHD